MSGYDVADFKRKHDRLESFTLTMDLLSQRCFRSLLNSTVSGRSEKKISVRSQRFFERSVRMAWRAGTSQELSMGDSD
jgi:hypothetical protein